jgi:ferredoxin-nitrite reductase
MGLPDTNDSTVKAGSELVVGDLRLCPDTLKAYLGETSLSLTVQEFDLLALLAKSAGKPVSQADLSQQLWGEVTPDRKRHLSVLVARLRTKLADSKPYKLRTLRKRGYGLMLPPVNRIEGLKIARDGLDSLDDILRYARTGDAIDPDDIERMKWYGLFYRRQTPGFFMLRLRVPNGILTAAQITEVGRLSRQFGRGQVDITTRQNVQLQWIRIQDVPVIFEALQRAGLEYRQSGMDNVRNITGCPMAGLASDELLDASPITRQLQSAIVGQKAFSNLPRKFNLSVSGCRHDCTTSQLHDLSLTPALKHGRAGFNVLVGGMAGDSPSFAEDLDVFVTPEQAVEFCLAVVELFRDKGNREERQRSRLRWLRDDWGIVRLRSELEARLGPLQHAGESQIEAYGGDHIGVMSQKQPSLSSVGCLVPVGRMEAGDLSEFGRLAEVYGTGELRLTNSQNVIIVNVPDERLPSLLAEPLLQTYSCQPPSWLQGTVSCTGRDFCQHALIDTKGSAVDFARRMQNLLPSAEAMRVHWSGCSRGCGRHRFGDIGFEAVRVSAGEELVDGVDVFMGGPLGEDPRLAEPVLRNVALSELPERIVALLQEHEAEGAA